MPPKMKMSNTFIHLAPGKKKAVLTGLGAKPGVIDMILELDKKAKEIAIKDPNTAAAWGAGCGGVTC